nr:glycosyltransferase family 4 protein [Halomonas dongshanensis]
MQICLSRGWGGLEMYPARIMPELQRQGAVNHALALSGSRVAESVRRAGADVFTVKSPLGALLAVRRLLAYIDSHAIEVLHCHKSSDLRIGALLAQLRPRLRLYFTEHMGVTRPKKGLYHRFAYAQVTRVFAISQATYRRNLKALPLPPERILCLGLGIDTAPFQAPPLTRSDLGLPPEGCLIALPGRLTPGKGHEVWLDALAQLAPQPSWHGVIIGGLKAEEGSDEAYVAQLHKRVAELGLEGRVSFTGFRSDLPQLLRALDIVCIPSRNEAFGLTVIEAMAAGAAVIGADSGAIPEVIHEDTGRLADPDSCAAWATALAALIEDAAERRRLGANARQWVEANLSLETHVAHLLDAYRLA